MATRHTGDLRSAIAQASTRIEQVLTAKAVNNLRLRSQQVMWILRNTYSDIFTTITNIAGGDAAVPGESRGSPAIFKDIGAPAWKKLSEPWLKKKEKYGPYPEIMDFYHGISSGIKRHEMFGVRTRKRKARKPRGNRGLPLHTYLEGLATAGNGEKAVQKFFGPASISYSMRRPDGAEVWIAKDLKASGAIGHITNVGPKGFLKSMDGTVLTAQIFAFPKLAGLMASKWNLSGNMEDRVTRFMAAQDPGHLRQWQKIFGQRKGALIKRGKNKGQMSDSTWKIRPLVTPVLQWYLTIEFERALRRLKDEPVP